MHWHTWTNNNVVKNLNFEIFFDYMIKTLEVNRIYDGNVNVDKMMHA